MAQQAGVAFYVAPFAFLTRHHEIVATTILVLQVLGVFRKKSCLPSPGLGIAQATEAAGRQPSQCQCLFAGHTAPHEARLLRRRRTGRP